MSRSDAFARTSEPPERGPSSSRLSREQLLDRIMSLNPTATSEFLARFGEDDLEEYLQRLTRASGPRGRREGPSVRTAQAPSRAAGE
jgi:hypothetical protein